MPVPSKADKDKALRLAYRDTFASESGKVVLSDLMATGFFFVPCFVPGDSYATAYNAGVASVVQQIVRYISETRLPDEFINHRTQIVRESHDPLE